MSSNNSGIHRLPPADLANVRQGLTLKPQNLALRMRLLKHHHAMGDDDAFFREALIYRDTMQLEPGGADWDAVRRMGRELLPASYLFADTTSQGHIPGALLHAAPRPGELPRRPRFGENADAAPAFQTYARQYAELMRRPQSQLLSQIDLELTRHAGRPTALLHLQRLSTHDAGAQIFVKQENETSTDAHLNIFVCGQGLLARALGKQRLISATINGNRGMAVAATAARLGLKATVHIDRRQANQQRARVQRMRLMDAIVQQVDVRLLPSEDIREAALADWLAHQDDSLLVMGLDAGPEPYLRIARDTVSVIGRETRRQIMGQFKHGPAALVTRGGDNADALGLFPPFLKDTSVRLVTVEPHSNSVSRASENPFAIDLSPQQQRVANAIIEGLEYPGVSREQAALRASGRVEFEHTTRADAQQTIVDVARLEGLILPMATAHAMTWARRLAATLPGDQAVVVLLGERPNKQAFDIDLLNPTGPTDRSDI